MSIVTAVALEGSWLAFRCCAISVCCCTLPIVYHWVSACPSSFLLEFVAFAHMSCPLSGCDKKHPVHIPGAQSTNRSHPLTNPPISAVDRLSGWL